MRDFFNRIIDYVRVSVTDRCNFRCAYCMPPEGVKLLSMDDVLTYEEMLRMIAVLGRLGVDKIRLTGGEPLVRRGIVEFIQEISALGTIKDISMTTNASLLAGLAHDLKEAGLQRVNISLDTVNPERFAAITCNGRLEDTLQGIESAFAAGLEPVKINVVLTAACTESDLAYFVEQVYRRPLLVRFIEYMPIGNCGVKPGLAINDVKKIINAFGRGKLYSEREPLAGGGPARYYRLPGARGSFGFITPISEHFCHQCNRLRMTADGKFKPCLLSDQEIDFKPALRGGESDEVLANLFYQAVQLKPAGHNLHERSEHPDFKRKMSQIGG